MSRRQLATWTVRVAAGLLALVGVAGIVLGALLVVEDLSTQGEMFDGIGTLIGVVVGGAGVVLGGVALVCVRLARAHLVGAAVTICVLGALVAGVGWLATGAVGLTVAAPLVLGGLLLGGLGFGAALGASA